MNAGIFLQWIMMKIMNPIYISYQFYSIAKSLF